MKRAIGLGLLAVSLGMGCVYSLNPFYTDEARIRMPELNGAWVMLNDKGEPENQKPWVFSDDKIQTFSEKGGSGALIVAYFRVGDRTFMDSTADSPDEHQVSEWWTFHLVDTHLLCRVETNGGRLTFRPLNYDWVNGALEDGTISLPHIETEGNEPPIFHATRAQWMDFLQQHGTNDEAFPAKGQYVFARPALTNAPQN